MKNRNGLFVNAQTTKETDTVKPNATLQITGDVPGDDPVKRGAHKGYNNRSFVDGIRQANMATHVAQKKNSTTDG